MVHRLNTYGVLFTATGVGSGSYSTVFKNCTKSFARYNKHKRSWAIGNNIANDTAAIAAAALQAPIYSPSGTYKSTAATPITLASTLQVGYGQIKTADANKSAPKLSIITAAPSSLGDQTSYLTAFNGDLSRCQNAMGQVVTGAATLGQPTTGYLYTPEAMPNYTYVYNTSVNQSTTSNVGRTGYAAYRTLIEQRGQGDAVCYNGSVFVTGTRTWKYKFFSKSSGSFI
jgi:hypothetical protein